MGHRHNVSAGEMVKQKCNSRAAGGDSCSHQLQPFASSADCMKIAAVSSREKCLLWLSKSELWRHAPPPKYSTEHQHNNNQRGTSVPAGSSTERWARNIRTQRATHNRSDSGVCAREKTMATSRMSDFAAKMNPSRTLKASVYTRAADKNTKHELTSEDKSRGHVKEGQIPHSSATAQSADHSEDYHQPIQSITNSPDDLGSSSLLLPSHVRKLRKKINKTTDRERPAIAQDKEYVSSIPPTAVQTYDPGGSQQHRSSKYQPHSCRGNHRQHRSSAGDDCRQMDNGKQHQWQTQTKQYDTDEVGNCQLSTSDMKSHDDSLHRLRSENDLPSSANSDNFNYISQGETNEKRNGRELPEHNISDEYSKSNNADFESGHSDASSTNNEQQMTKSRDARSDNSKSADSDSEHVQEGKQHLTPNGTSAGDITTEPSSNVSSIAENEGFDKSTAPSSNREHDKTRYTAATNKTAVRAERERENETQEERDSLRKEIKNSAPENRAQKFRVKLKTVGSKLKGQRDEKNNKANETADYMKQRRFVRKSSSKTTAVNIENSHKRSDEKHQRAETIQTHRDDETEKIGDGNHHLDIGRTAQMMMASNSETAISDNEAENASLETDNNRVMAVHHGHKQAQLKSRDIAERAGILHRKMGADQRKHGDIVNRNDQRSIRREDNKSLQLKPGRQGEDLERSASNKGTQTESRRTKTVIDQLDVDRKTDRRADTVRNHSSRQNMITDDTGKRNEERNVRNNTSNNGSKVSTRDNQTTARRNMMRSRGENVRGDTMNHPSKQDNGTPKKHKIGSSIIEKGQFNDEHDNVPPPEQKTRTFKKTRFKSDETIRDNQYSGKMRQKTAGIARSRRAGDERANKRQAEIAGNSELSKITASIGEQSTTQKQLDMSRTQQMNDNTDRTRNTDEANTEVRNGTLSSHSDVEYGCPDNSSNDMVKSIQYINDVAARDDDMTRSTEYSGNSVDLAGNDRIYRRYELRSPASDGIEYITRHHTLTNSHKRESRSQMRGETSDSVDARTDREEVIGEARRSSIRSTKTRDVVVQTDSGLTKLNLLPETQHSPTRQKSSRVVHEHQTSKQSENSMMAKLSQKRGEIVAENGTARKVKSTENAIAREETAIDRLFYTNVRDEPKNSTKIREIWKHHGRERAKLGQAKFPTSKEQSVRKQERVTRSQLDNVGSMKLQSKATAIKPQSDNRAVTEMPDSSRRISLMYENDIIGSSDEDDIHSELPDRTEHSFQSDIEQRSGVSSAATHRERYINAIRYHGDQQHTEYQRRTVVSGTLPALTRPSPLHSQHKETPERQMKRPNEQTTQQRAVKTQSKKTEHDEINKLKAAAKNYCTLETIEMQFVPVQVVNRATSGGEIDYCNIQTQAATACLRRIE